MVGFLQIIIYVLSIYLVYKGVEIFQIALVSSDEIRTRKAGVVIGILAIVGAIGVAIGAVAMSEMQAASMQQNMQNIPRF